jgi:hypothetical protein
MADVRHAAIGASIAAAPLSAAGGRWRGVHAEAVRVLGRAAVGVGVCDGGMGLRGWEAALWRWVAPRLDYRQPAPTACACPHAQPTARSVRAHVWCVSAGGRGMAGTKALMSIVMTRAGLAESISSRKLAHSSAPPPCSTGSEQVPHGPTAVATRKSHSCDCAHARTRRYAKAGNTPSALGAPTTAHARKTRCGILRAYRACARVLSNAHDMSGRNVRGASRPR